MEMKNLESKWVKLVYLTYIRFTYIKHSSHFHTLRSRCGALLCLCCGIKLFEQRGLRRGKRKKFRQICQFKVAPKLKKLSEWVSEWVRVSEWVSEWVRKRECIYMSNYKWYIYKWTSEWVTGGSDSSERNSTITRRMKWASKSKWMSEWVNEWVSAWLTEPTAQWLYFSVRQ